MAMSRFRLRMNAGDPHPRECLTPEIPPTTLSPVPTRSTFSRQDRAESFYFMASATLRRHSRSSRMNFTLPASVCVLRCCRATDARSRSSLYRVATSGSSSLGSKLAAFKKRYAVVSVVGLSMGAALSAILAAENPDLNTLVVIAPYFGMRLNYRAASLSHWIWGPIAGTVKSKSPTSIYDPVEREKNLGYGVYTGRLLYELWRLARRARLSLPQIRMPTL